MKKRNLIVTAVTVMMLTVAGSSLAMAAPWTCPGGYYDCQGQEYCQNQNHANCGGGWSEDGNWVCSDGNHHYEGYATTNNSYGNGHHGRGCGSHHR